MRSFLTVASLASLLHVSLLAIGCASGNPTSPPSPGVTQEGKVVSPTTGLEVTVALASAHLGAEKCTHDESADLKTKSCAVNIADSGPPLGTGPCGGPCDFSALQISFTAAATGQKSHVKITEALLLDASTRAELQTLSASTPLVWSGTQYTPWDETIAPSAALKASYTLSPPAWSTVDTSNSYSRQYKVHLVIELDGTSVTLESDALNRDPPVST